MDEYGFPDVPLAYRLGAAIVALSIAAYAVLTAQLFLGLLIIVGLVVITLVCYLVYLLVVLFYRLVVAVEHLAYEE